jgi:hypothetical protein
MLTSEVTVTVQFRRSGWQRPLREGDTVRLLGPQAAVLAEFPGAFVLTLLRHYLADVQLHTAFAQQLRPGPPLEPDPPDSARPAPPAPRLVGATGRRLRR